MSQKGRVFLIKPYYKRDEIQYELGINKSNPKNISNNIRENWLEEQLRVNIAIYAYMCMDILHIYMGIA